MSEWNDKGNLPTKSFEYVVLKKDGTTEIMFFDVGKKFWSYITKDKDLIFADGEIFPWKEIENRKSLDIQKEIA